MTNAHTFLLLAIAIFNLWGSVQAASAAGIDYSAPYCAKPKTHTACTPEGSPSIAPKGFPKGGWPTRSIPFVYGKVEGVLGGDKLKNAIRAVLKDVQSHSPLTFYECTDEPKLRAHITSVMTSTAAKPAYMRFSFENRQCKNESMGYPITSTWLDVVKGGPDREAIGISEVKIGGSQCSEVDPMGIGHEILHGLGFYHNLESPKADPYFKLTGAPDPKFLKIKQLQQQSVAGVAFAKTEFDYFSLVGSNVEAEGQAIFAPKEKFKQFAAQVKKRYGIDIYYTVSKSGGPFGTVNHDTHFNQSSCLSQGDSDKLDLIYGPSSGLKCDAFNISSVPSCKPLQ
ncbi:hypothetical protein [Sinorhizobium meliloti]|uniref:hypothetical protein n=1 Tax=Rhizobium meliloti TaxID=382 RepID=UPI0004A2FC79|nr:hypothetical protein [Sinorhizobium meliloti]ARS71082.1 hypothetical protein SMRU11_29450 [Sinorhizobium meliloti RU11/001]